MKQVIVLCLIVVLAAFARQLPAIPASKDSQAMMQRVTRITLTAVEQGDMSCYIRGVDNQGVEQILPADFDLCPGAPFDASNLAGLSVQLTWGKANVLSASCDGDIDCGKSDNIDIVKSLAPIQQ